MNLTELIAAGMKPADALKLRAKLYAKIEKVANDVGGLKKEGRCDLGRGKGFNFISHEQVTEALRPLLLKHKISVVPEILSDEERDFEKTTTYNGQTRTTITTRTKVNILIYITDTETGFQSSFKFGGAEQDNGGKSYQQAVSQAVKYAQFKLFKITEGETDGDKKQTVIESEKPAAAPQRQTTVSVNTPAIQKAAGRVQDIDALNALWRGLSAEARANDTVINIFTTNKKRINELKASNETK